MEWPCLPRFRIPETPCSPRFCLVVSKSWLVQSPVLLPDVSSALPGFDTYIDSSNTPPVVSALASKPNGEFVSVLCLRSLCFYSFTASTPLHIPPSGSMIEIVLINPLTPNPYCTESLPCAEGLGGAAAERNKRFFPKITARLVFKIKSSFFFPFLVNGYHASVRNVKK